MYMQVIVVIGNLHRLEFAGADQPQFSSVGDIPFKQLLVYYCVISQNKSFRVGHLSQYLDPLLNSLRFCAGGKTLIYAYNDRDCIFHIG